MLYIPIWKMIFKIVQYEYILLYLSALFIVLCLLLLFRICDYFGSVKDRKRSPKGSPKQQNYKCCRLSLIEPVHGR